MSTNSLPLVLAAGLVLAASGAALAAPMEAQGVTRVAEATSTLRPVAAAEAEEDAGTCSRLRRRLWVEGEGWVVRRITTCR